MENFKKDLKYFFIVGISGLSGLGLVFLLKSRLTDVDFANYVESSIYFNLILILIELGGYTKLQFHITRLDSYSGMQFGFSVITYHNIIYCLWLFYIYLFQYDLLVYSFLNVLLYTNYIWLFTALNKESDYYGYLIVQKLFAFFFVYFINWKYLLLIASIFHFFFLFILFRRTQLKFLIFRTNLKKLFSLSCLFSITSLVNQLTLRLIDFRILNSGNIQTISTYGYVKSIYDRIGSLISQHIVNRSFVFLTSLNFVVLLKIFMKSMLIVIGLFLLLIMDTNNVFMLSFYHKLILLVLFTIMILNSMLIRLLLKISYDKYLLAANIIIFLLLKYGFFSVVGLELVVVHLLLILVFLVMGLVYKVKLKLL